jgi:hypothetical protein
MTPGCYRSPAPDLTADAGGGPPAEVGVEVEQPAADVVLDQRIAEHAVEDVPVRPDGRGGAGALEERCGLVGLRVAQAVPVRRLQGLGVEAGQRGVLALV